VFNRSSTDPEYGVVWWKVRGGQLKEALLRVALTPMFERG
jgi:hypothetical protein